MVKQRTKYVIVAAAEAQDDRTLCENAEAADMLLGRVLGTGLPIRARHRGQLPLASCSPPMSSRGRMSSSTRLAM